MERLKKCVLCKEEMRNVAIQLPCLHAYCEGCIDKFETGESSICPQCKHTFSHPSDAQPSTFLTHLLTNHPSLGSDQPCRHHPSLLVNFFCINCEVTGCPLCSTGCHDGHDFIALHDMAKVIREELEDVCVEVQVARSKVEKQIETQKRTQSDTRRHLNNTCDLIKERAELLKVAIDRQVESLLTQVKQVEKRMLRNDDNDMRQCSQLIDNNINYFSDYVSCLIHQGSSQDLVDNIRLLKARSSEIKCMRVLNKDAHSHVHVRFLPSSLHAESISLVGHLDLSKPTSSKHHHHHDLSNGNEHTNNAMHTDNQTDNETDKQTDKQENVEDTQEDSNASNKTYNNDNSLDKSASKIKIKKELLFENSVSALTVDKGHLYVAYEMGGQVCIYNLEDYTRQERNLKVVGLEAAWDMTSLINHSLHLTSLFIIDNLKGCMFQIDIPHNNNNNDEYSQRIWQLQLDGSATITTSPDNHLLITTTNNKLFEYSLVSLLISSSSSPPLLLSSSSSSLPPSSSSTPLPLPPPIHEFSIIPHMTDILHAIKLPHNKYAVLYHHLYELSGIFLVNAWGHMEGSFGGPRGHQPHQLDFPCHIALHPSSSSSSSSSSLPHDEVNDTSILFVCDNSNDRVSCFNHQLQHTAVSIENISSPWRLAVIPNKKILLVLTLNHSVCVYQY